jgi:hypothetical protein
MAKSLFIYFSCKLRFLRAVATIQRPFASAQERLIGHSCFTVVDGRSGFGLKMGYLKVE